jgi:hypothetical protein
MSRRIQAASNGRSGGPGCGAGAGSRRPSSRRRAPGTDRIDQRAAGDLDQDGHDGEDDQPDQGPDQGPGQGREVAAGGIAGGPEPGGEQRRGCPGLPDRLGIRSRVGAEVGAVARPMSRPNPNSRVMVSPPSAGRWRSWRCGSRRRRGTQPAQGGEVAAQVGAGREQAGGDRDQPMSGRARSRPHPGSSAAQEERCSNSSAAPLSRVGSWMRPASRPVLEVDAGSVRPTGRGCRRPVLARGQFGAGTPPPEPA